MTHWHTLAHCLRRSYLALLLVLLAAWVARTTVFEAPQPWQQSAARLALPGELVVAVVAVFSVAIS